MGGWCAEALVVLLLGCGVRLGAAGREEAGRVSLKGGDVSLLTRIEELGGVYREGGERGGDGVNDCVNDGVGGEGKSAVGRRQSAGKSKGGQEGGIGGVNDLVNGGDGERGFSTHPLIRPSAAPDFVLFPTMFGEGGNALPGIAVSERKSP